MKKQLLALAALALYSAAGAQTGNVGIGTATPGSKLQVVGSFSANYRNVTASGTTALTSTDFYTAYAASNTAAGNFTLPAAATPSLSGRVYYVKNDNATYAVTVTPNGAETINGAVSITVPAGQTAQLISTGAATGSTWEVVVIAASTAAGAAVAGADNGLTVGYNSPGKVGLGGTLAKNTDVALGSNNLTFNGSTPGATGNIGIGLTNPAFKVDVLGNSVFTIGERLVNTYTGASASSSLYLGNDASSIGASLTLNSSAYNNGSVNQFNYLSLNNNIAGAPLTFGTVPTGGSASLERMRIDPAGNVGIGTSAPNHVLDLGTANGGGSLTSATGKKLALFDNAAGTDFYGLGISSGYLQFHASSTATSAPGMVLASTTGNVGIATGTTGPSEKLQVGSTAITAPLSMSVQNAQGQGRIGMANVAGDYGASQPGDLMINQATTGKGVGISTVGTNATMYVANTGNVGVNTTAPQVPLEVSNVNGGARGRIMLSNYNGGTATGIGAFMGDVMFSANDGTATIPSSTNAVPNISGITTEAWSSTAHGSAISFRVIPNGTTAAIAPMRIDQNGNVGIGTNAPGSTLQINGSLAANYNQVTAATYTMAATDFYVVYNGTTTATITLPAAGTGTMKGRLYTIKNTTAAQTLTVAANGTETIDGTASFVIAPGNSIQLVSTGLTTGATWEVVNFAATTTSTGTTLYTGDGTLSGNRTVTMGASNLNLSSTTGTVNITGNQNSLARTSFLNSNAGASSRTDIGIQAGTTNPGLFMGIDNGSSIFGAGSKAYIDNRSGGRLILGTNGGENLTVSNTTGNVGIGNSAASDKFVVGSTSNVGPLASGVMNSVAYGRMGIANVAGDYGAAASGDLMINQTTTGKGVGISVVGTTAPLYVASTGNVGIGNTLPSAQLEVTSTQGAYNQLRVGTTAGHMYMGYDATNNTGVINQDGSKDIDLETNVNSRVRILASNGNVGIGIIAPQAPLAFTNGAGKKIELFDDNIPSTNAFQYYGFGIGSATTEYHVGANTSAHVFYSGASTTTQNEIMRVSGNGSTTLTGNATGAVTLNVKGNYNAVSQGVRLDNTSATGGAMTITPGFNYATGLQDAAAASFDIIGSGNFVFSDNIIPQANNSFNLGSATYRWATIYSQNALNTSDRRAKKDIRNIHYGLDAVMKLRPVSYNWKEGSTMPQLGFIAQEVEPVIPDAVVAPKTEKELYAMNYNAFLPVLTKAIQEQQAEIEALKAANAKLTAEATAAKAQAAKVADLETAMAEMRAELSKVVLRKVAGKNVAKK